MHFARHTLSRTLLAVATLAALVACKQATPLATSGSAEAAEATTEATPADTAVPAAPAEASPAPAALADTAPTPVEARPVVADKAAKDAVIAAMGKFKALRSYRMTILRGDGQASPSTTVVDYVAPDRYRMQAAGMPEQVVIGDTLYTTDAAGTKSGPVDAVGIGGWRDPNGLVAAGNDFTAEKGGRRFVFAMPATEYKLHATRPMASNMSLWIGPQGLPIKMETQGMMNGKPVTTLVKYSNFDSAEIKIDTPK